MHGSGEAGGSTIERHSSPPYDRSRCVAMLIRHANPKERLTGWSDGLRGYPAGAAYRCPRCGVATDFPQPSSRLDSYISDDARNILDTETQATRIPHSAAVDFYCCGCSSPVRILLNHFADGKSVDSWSVIDILEPDWE